MDEMVKEGEVLKTSVPVPEEILNKIKTAYIAGCISITLTIIVTLISIFVTDIMGIDAFAFIDVALMIIFTFGIYKNSRVCAILMLAFFVLTKIVMWAEAGSPQGLPVALLFIYFYAQGVMGTFQYHQHLKKQKGH
jgi:hypothetical protein